MSSTIEWSARLVACAAALAIGGQNQHAFAQGPAICPDNFPVLGGFNLPVCRNLGFDLAQPQVTRLVVAIHGAERQATVTYDAVVAAAEQARQDDTTLIVAPQFLNPTDPGLPDGSLYWTGTQWRFGNRSVNGNPRLSAYEVLDAILLAVVDSGNFPNLSNVVVAGHSAGGQFTQRFASASPVERHISGELGIPMRYVAMNPGSWLYLDPARWDPDCEIYIAPDAAKCPGYDDYGYGLSANLNEYMRAAGADRIRTQFGQRQLTYLLGDHDICRPDETCTTPPGSPPPDGGCAAMLQGGNRFERGSVFYGYIQYFYGPDILSRHSLAIVPDVGHDGTAMFTSAQSLSAVFDFSQ